MEIGAEVEINKTEIEIEIKLWLPDVAAHRRHSSSMPHPLQVTTSVISSSMPSCVPVLPPLPPSTSASNASKIISLKHHPWREDNFSSPGSRGMSLPLDFAPPSTDRRRRSSPLAIGKTGRLKGTSLPLDSMRPLPAAVITRVHARVHGIKHRLAPSSRPKPPVVATFPLLILSPTKHGSLAYLY